MVEPPETGKIGVLFVCTGNICRSPTAEAVFRHQARKGGFEHRFLIDSAGTHGYHVGDPPDKRAIETALARGGVDMRDLRARRFDVADFNRFHYVLAMDRGHHAFLSRLRPDDHGGLSLFLEGGADVPDPYYGTQKDFDLVYRLAEVGSARWLQHILSQSPFPEEKKGRKC